MCNATYSIIHYAIMLTLTGLVTRPRDGGGGGGGGGEGKGIITL